MPKVIPPPPPKRKEMPIQELNSVEKSFVPSGEDSIKNDIQASFNKQILFKSLLLVGGVLCVIGGIVCIALLAL